MEACDVNSLTSLNNHPASVIVNRVLGVLSVSFMFISFIILNFSTLTFFRLSEEIFKRLIRISSIFMLLGFALISVTTVIFAVEIKKSWDAQAIRNSCIYCYVMQWDFGWALYLIWSEAFIMIPTGKDSIKVRVYFLLSLKICL